MIDFTEVFFKDGDMRAFVRSEALPRGMYCLIDVTEEGVMRKTRAHGNGSVRYHWHRTYSEAQEAAIKWASRKIAEAKRQATLH